LLLLAYFQVASVKEVSGILVHFLKNKHSQQISKN